MDICVSHSVQLFATPWPIACRAPLSMEFSRQEYWSGQPFPSPGDLFNPGIKLRSPTLQANSLPSEPPGKPKNTGVGSLSLLQWIFPTQEQNCGLLHCRWITSQATSFTMYYCKIQGVQPIFYSKYKWTIIIKNCELLFINHKSIKKSKPIKKQIFNTLLLKSLQSCLTLCDPIDGSPPGSPVPGILQARTLEWVAISFSNEWR